MPFWINSLVYAAAEIKKRFRLNCEPVQNVFLQLFINKLDVGSSDSQQKIRYMASMYCVLYNFSIFFKLNVSDSANTLLNL